MVGRDHGDRGLAEMSGCRLIQSGLGPKRPMPAQDAGWNIVGIARPRHLGPCEEYSSASAHDIRMKERLERCSLLGSRDAYPYPNT